VKDIQKIFVTFQHTLKDTMVVIQEGGVGIAVIVDRFDRLVGTITDGDIRRALLNKIPLTKKIRYLLENHSLHHPQPTTAPMGTTHDHLLEIMKEKVIRHIPIVDQDGRMVELALLSELIEEESLLPVTVVVMAGGKGQRLFPLTRNTPKPMLLLNDRPLMEHTIAQLRKSGITKVNITTNYKSEVIMNHFGDGNKFGVEINYINEELPLGTAGSLGLMNISDKPILIINGDILTQLDFRAMFDFHQAHQAAMTVGVRKIEMKIPYGVVETDDVVITEFVEKPQQTFLANAGIYLLDPMVCQYIPRGRCFDMTELVELLIKTTHRVISFPIQEYWLDIGEHDHYKKAKNDVKSGKF